jgi:iron complex transport system ATP-binding protein
LNSPLAVENLCVVRSKGEVLHNIDCNFAPRSITALVGPNGAGKSTLLKCLAGILPTYSGSVSIEGTPLPRYSRRQLAELISYLPQRYTLQASQSVNEFVLMSRYFRMPRFSGPAHEDLERVSQALTLTGASDLALRRLSELSGGEQQRVLWASAIAQDSRILLLDEPFHALDPQYQDKMVGVLHHLRDTRNLAIVLATHDINIAAIAAEQILALKDGRRFFFGSRQEFMTGGNLEAIYGKNFSRVSHPTRNFVMILPG